MNTRSLPSRSDLVVGLAHPSYRLADALRERAGDIAFLEARTTDELAAIIERCHVLAQASVLWRPELLAKAPPLCFIQSLSVGVEHFDLDSLKSQGIRVASARGIVDRAVAEHALALMLSMVRQLPAARDRQRTASWRPTPGDPALREGELGGRTLLIVGLGSIGNRLARLAKALDMRVLATRAHPERGRGDADAVFATSDLPDLLPQADIVVLTCPLTDGTAGLIGAEALRLMRPSALLINVARGRVVDEAALIQALQQRQIGGAALDCFEVEPLPPRSPLWGMPNVIVTPHSAGNTGHYESRLVELLMENLERLWRGEGLVNGVA